MSYYTPFYDKVDFDDTRVGGHFEKLVENREPARLRVWLRLTFFKWVLRSDHANFHACSMN